MPDINYFFFPIAESEIKAYGKDKDGNPLLEQNPAYDTKSSFEQN